MGTLRQVFYLSDALSPPMTPYPPPPYTQFTCIQYSYSRREGWERRELTREKVRGADCISSLETLLNTSKDDF
jgi:hypothetical protein